MAKLGEQRSIVSLGNVQQCVKMIIQCSIVGFLLTYRLCIVSSE